jgi:hypothetical protein
MEITILKVYVSHDSIPLLYSCKNKQESFFLALSVDMEEDKDIELFAPVTQKQISVLEDGIIDLRYIYKDNPQKYVYKVVTQNKKKEITKLEINKIPEKWLPGKKVKLRN